MAGGDYFVGFICDIGGGESLLRGGGGGALGVQEEGGGLRDAVPAVVAVHGMEAAAEGGEGGAVGQVVFERFQLLGGGFRGDVAAVQEGVDMDGEALGGEDAGGLGDVALMAVHAAGGGEAGQVHGASRGLGLGSKVLKRRVFFELAGLDRAVDAGQVHPDDAAGADVGVADLGVAHLAVRQADGGAVGGQGRGGPEVIRRSKTGVRAWATALPSAASRRPQPSRMTRQTG